MTTPKTETGHAAGFILSEAAGQRSRENVTFEGGNTLLAGQVVSTHESGSDAGIYTPFDQDVATTDVAQGISINDVEENATSTQTIAIIRRDAEVNGDELVWPDDITDNEKATAIAELATLGIIVR